MAARTNARLRWPAAWQASCMAREPSITGVRVEELLELSHHSFVEYRLPSTGELVPLL